MYQSLSHSDSPIVNNEDEDEDISSCIDHWSHNLSSIQAILQREEEILEIPSPGSKGVALATEWLLSAAELSLSEYSVLRLNEAGQGRQLTTTN